MLSALKRLVTTPDGKQQSPDEITSGINGGKNGANLPSASGVRCMDASLQRKFAKGVQYNSKCIVKLSQFTLKVFALIVVAV